MKYLFYIFFFLFCAATTVTAQTVSQVRSQSTDPTYTPSGAVTAPPLCYNRTTHHLWGYAGGYWYDLTAGTYVDLDPSPTNEKIVSFSVVSNVLRINENGIFYNVPINDIVAAANISSSSPTITVTNVAGVITVTSTDPDEDATNECNTSAIVNGGNLEITDPCGTQSVAVTNIAPVQAIAAGTGISTSVAGGTVTITNTDPDQTVTVTGAGINTVTGTYPSFTVTGTEVDGSTTNEVQTLTQGYGTIITPAGINYTVECDTTQMATQYDLTQLIPPDLCTQIQALPIGAPAPTDKIVYFGGGVIPAGFVGFDFDNANDFSCSGGDPTTTWLHDMQFSGGNAPAPAPIPLTDAAAINSHINTVVIPAYNLVNSPPLAVGDIVWQYNSGSNTVTVWYNPTLTLYPTNFIIGDILGDCEKAVPTIPTTQPATGGCFLGDAPSGAAKVANGLYTSNDTIKLGGALIENTFVVGAMDKTMILAITDTVNTINKVDLSSAGVQLKSEGSPSTSEVTLNVGDLLLRGETAVKIVTPNTPASPNGSVLTLIDNLTGEAEWQPAAAQDTTAWRLTGNAGTDGGTTNFVGTTDAQDLVLKTNGTEIARFGTTPNHSISLHDNNNVSSGFHSLAIGVYTQATGYSSFSGGDSAAATGDVSFAFGTSSQATAQDAVAIASSVANGEQSFSVSSSVANGYGSFAAAQGTANGASSFAAIKGKTNGDYSVAFGDGIESQSYFEYSLGNFNKLYTPIDPIAFNPADRLFTIGNGINTATRNNALTLWKDGRSMWNGDIAKANTWIGVNGTNPQNFINVTTQTGSLAAISTEHTTSGNYAVLGSNAGNSGLVINNTKQFAFTTTAGTTSTALGATTTVANYSNTGFLFGGGGAATSTLDVAGSFSLPVVIVAASTTVTDTNCSIECNNGATAITLTLPAAATCRGRIYMVHSNAGSTGTVTITPSGGQIQALAGTLGATTSISALGSYGQHVWFQSDGTNWVRIN